MSTSSSILNIVGLFYFNHLRVCVGISLFGFVFPRWPRLNNFRFIWISSFMMCLLTSLVYFCTRSFFFIALQCFVCIGYESLVRYVLQISSPIWFMSFVVCLCVCFVLFHCSFTLLLTSSDEWKFFSVTQFVRVSLYGQSFLHPVSEMFAYSKAMNIFSCLIFKHYFTFHISVHSLPGIDLCG